MTCASFGCKAAKARSTPAASSLVWPPVYSLGPGGKPMSQTSLAELLSLASPPVAIAFVDAVPPGVPHVSAVEPAGCGYWRRAAAGEVFYTGADDTEAYFAIPGLHLGAVEEKLAVIVRANQEMEKFHRGRAAATPTA